MKSLQELYTIVPKENRHQVFDAVMTFHKANVFLDDSTSKLIVVGKDYAAFRYRVNALEEINALGAQTDLTLVLETMEELHETLNLQQFKCIEISRSGLTLMQIWHPEVNESQSACVDIHDYRRRLQDRVPPPMPFTIWIDYVFVVIMTTIAMVALWNLLALN